MNLPPEISPTDGAMHLRNIYNLIAADQSTNFNQFISFAQTYASLSDDWGFTPSSGVTPKTVWLQDAVYNDICVFLLGMVNFDKVSQCLTGWSNNPATNGLSVYPYQDAAQAITAILPFSTIVGQPWRNVTIIGHSYGGAVAPFVASLLRNVASSTNIRIYTYGAPKTSPGFVFPNKLVTATRRVFNQADPVPTLPLGPGDTSNVWAFTGVPTARAWARWSQYCRGLTNSTGFALVPADNPVFVSSWGLILSLASWMTGAECFGNPNHSLAAYSQLFQQVPDAIVPSAQPITTPEPSRGHTLSGQNASVLVATAQAQQASLVAANPADAVAGVQSGVPVVPGQRFVGRKYGRRHAVLYGGEVILWVQTERVQKAVVRRLNRNLAPF